MTFTVELYCIWLYNIINRVVRFLFNNMLNSTHYNHFGSNGPGFKFQLHNGITLKQIGHLSHIWHFFLSFMHKTLFLLRGIYLLHNGLKSVTQDIWVSRVSLEETINLSVNYGMHLGYGNTLGTQTTTPWGFARGGMSQRSRFFKIFF